MTKSGWERRQRRENPNYQRNAPHVSKALADGYTAGVHKAWLDQKSWFESEIKQAAAEGWTLDDINGFTDEVLDLYRRQLEAVRSAALEGKWMPDVIRALNSVKPTGQYIELAPEEPERTLQDRVEEKFFGRGNR